MPAKRTAMLQCLAAAALFGLSTPASKLLLEAVPPLLLAGLLYLGAALATLPAALRQGGNLRRIDRHNFLRLGGAVVCGGVLGPVLLLWGLSLAPAASVALWLNLETVATVLLAWIWFREHLSACTFAAAGLVISASLLLMWPFDPTIGRAGLLVVLATFAWGIDNHLTALIDRLSPAQTTFAKGLVAGVVNLSLGYALAGNSLPSDLVFRDSAGALPGSLPDIASVLGALAVGGLSYGASIVLYIRGAQQIGATRSQLIFSSAPFWGVLLSWLWLGAPVLVVQLIATGFMILAIWLLNTEHHCHQHTHERLTHEHVHRHDDGHHHHSHAPEYQVSGSAQASPAGCSGHPSLPGVDEASSSRTHSHEHTHEPVTHTHPHVPDLHHRHEH